MCISDIFDYIINHRKIKLGTAFTVSAMLLITYSMNCLIKLKDMSDAHGLAYVVLALCGGWLADTGAYLQELFLVSIALS